MRKRARKDPWRGVKLVALSGYGGVGKDEVGRILCDYFGFARFAKGDLVKAVARRLGWKGDKNSGRWFLQDLADGLVDVLGRDVWNEVLFERVEAYINGARGGPVGIVLTRISTLGEAHEVEARGGQVWRVERPGYGPANAHPNETALDGWPFDRVISNTGDLVDLKLKVRAALVGSATARIDSGARV